MDEKRVRDIMRPPELTIVDEETTIQEVVMVLVQSSMESSTDPAVLVKENNTIVGMLDRNTILHYMEPLHTRGALEMEVFWAGLFSEQWKSIAGLKVRNLARPVLSIGPGDTLMKASHVIYKYRVSVLLVMDGKNWVGVIDASDLLKELVLMVPEKPYHQTA